MADTKFKASNYGEVLAVINDLELVSYREAGSYEGRYLAVLKDKNRLFYFIGYFGSCSGCDWLESVQDYDGFVMYEEAKNFCADIKPRYVVPEDRPLEFTQDNDEWNLAEAKS